MSIYQENPPSNTTTHHVQIGNNKIAYWHRPAPHAGARTLIFVHGNSASKAAFRALFESPKLNQYKLYALDLPGCGESDNAQNASAEYNMPALAKTIMDLVAALKLDEYSLLGWSLGGHICIEMLALGAKPQGVMLTGTPPCGPALAEVGEVFLPVAGAEVTGLVEATREQLALFATTIFAPSTPSAEMLAAVYRADGRLRGGIFEYLIGHQDEKPQRQIIAETNIPFALIQGTNEPFFDPRLVDNLAFGNLWRGATQWLEGAGHAPFIDNPDEYAGLIAEFVG